MIDFQTDPGRYRHWRLAIDGPVASLVLDVDEAGGLLEGYELKLNSYDLGVDLELHDAVQRLRFEHPAVKAVVLRSAKDRVFSAGANIRMLAGASHVHKVNFCRFTNETRLAIEDASTHSGQRYLAAIAGTAAGGGYELALAADHILLADDGNATLSLPEVPLLAVLPGTGGLTRLTDKRKVRPDLADVFCTLEEGVKGRRAVAWRLADETVSKPRFDAVVAERAAELAARSDRPDEPGIELTPLRRSFEPDAVRYDSLSLELDRAARTATLTVRGPTTPPPADAAAVKAEGAAFWPLELARELDDALLHLRLNEPEIAVVLIKSDGDPAAVMAYDALLERGGGDWLIREVVLLWKRTLKRLDATSRSFIALAEPGSCFAGFLAELPLAADRHYMFDGLAQGDNRAPATVTLSTSNFGRLPAANGIARVETRFLGEPERLQAAKDRIGEALDAAAASTAGLVTEAFDEIDWEDEIRIIVEERASFSPDALTGLHANLRAAGPETMETKIFGRLSAWQNWIFQRPNAVGETGALGRYGTGVKPTFDRKWV